jgi:hypothetical protein
MPNQAFHHCHTHPSGCILDIPAGGTREDAMTIREVLQFENNPQAMTCLQKQYAERRKIDKEIGNKSTVRYFNPGLMGANGNMTIVYEYETLAQLEQEWNKRSDNSRWTKFNEELVATGFKVVFRGMMLEVTPQ